ncbi:tRNA (N6-isopentenyl adenosine(37)-C2)-methylthiotransferase MiaB [Brotomerdimonas butyrica]|uniref:tRNA (N6-isopentenyl adenosine(37)-C2)-methylthiotransferase MiaB n=1 Tax=Brotomerdimonas butyrica TaxID=2981721 RepID=UPI0011CAD942|nr:tRNA (N6-isopentenyl adenosine(37)-C2)-methylthiotransferase MiaB [Brotomerdimonas butyrica]MCU6755490.1 tRNA (N6-isopentenyl adenosine(37)-C2)-methylthiotransferase MiaB [Brotomerdimonas butyrica]
MNKDKEMDLLNGKKYNIITFGCQMNEHDSETIAGMLQEKGCVETMSRDDSDITIINTCSVRENADKRFFGTLGQLKKLKEKNPEYVACVCGCMMQQQHIIDTIKSKYPWVDIIFGTHNIHRFPELLEKVYSEKKKIAETFENSDQIVEGLPAKRLYKHKSFVNIMYGCNNFCTYCIVPYTRGREKSRKPEDIVREITGLVADGVKEVTLLGQNVNSYRGAGESGSECDFADLIYMINDIEGLERIRFMTSHPKDLSDKLIQAFVDCNKLCNYIHLPVQAGSDRVLRRMNRKYTREKYLEVVERLRKAVPDIAISTDIIVGFPGETEEDFEETLSLVRSVKYDSAFTFLYSVRQGTPAAEYEDQIPEEVKHQRFDRLVDAVNADSAEKNAAYKGRIERVLVEGVSKKNENTLTGRTEGFKLVDFEGGRELIGQMVNVEITEGKTFSLTGKIAE